MQRVIEQGDFRPMSGTDEAMEDLKGILSSREDFYSKAHLSLDTSKTPLDSTFARLMDMLNSYQEP